jgi:hypothetical protein
MEGMESEIKNGNQAVYGAAPQKMRVFCNKTKSVRSANLLVGNGCVKFPRRNYVQQFL